MRDKSAISPQALSSLALVRRLVRDFIWRHAGQIALALVCMAIAAGSTALRAWLMEPVLDRIFIARDASLLVLLGSAALVLALTKGFADYGQTVLTNRVSQRVIADVQKASFARLIRADLAYFNATSSGLLISRLTNDVTLLRNAAANVLAGIGRDAITVVFLVGLMFYQDWLLAMIAFFAFPLAIRPIIGIGRRMRRVSANTQVEFGQFTTLLSQTFQGARHVKAYGMEEYEDRRAGALIERLFRLIDGANRTRSRATPMMEALGGAAIAVVILYGGQQVISGARTPGAFFSFITALLLAYQPVKALAILNAQLQEGLAAAQRVFQVLDIEPAIRDAPGAEPLRVTAGEVRFEEVRFGYHPGAVALDRISLSVPGGSTVALVGPSGAGKSTMMNLIPRFYDVDHGAISIDGQDVRSVTLASLRGAIALVAQEVSLFDDTVRANIAYGRFGASDREIEAAAAAAGADRFIRELAQGYDTMVGEHGVLLSGGQRQRLAIARAMLRDAPILLLDEATSALDNESERQVQAALRSLMRGRTTIVIAHRLSTVIGADLICVLDRGRIVESGRHAQLLARNGLYARLYETQFAEQDLAATVEAAAAAG
ncbi:MAG: ATP-binding cassette domain-containing protein [Alphaproteobacteria bacterium]|nr:ATP-binding cassette domain-containing protein [Alphaproteobacteria bacterium]MBV9965304.1 ATP-binding cassette domain-containing protein [Alphaproteobacteria bacterium]